LSFGWLPRVCIRPRRNNSTRQSRLPTTLAAAPSPLANFSWQPHSKQEVEGNLNHYFSKKHEIQAVCPVLGQFDSVPSCRKT
jgi:hypothetical protein